MHTHTRQYYLSDIPLSEALDRFHDALAQVGALEPVGAEILSLVQASGRITAAPVWAAQSSRVPGMFMPLEGASPSANLMEVASRTDLEG